MLNPEPEVELVNYFQNPYDNVVATARTCYSSKVVEPEDVSKTEKSRETRDRIFKSIYEAGHHTTMQHPTFQFVLRKVSRQFIWSFLHSHPFYNSEQVSQRYVEVKEENYSVPPIEGREREFYVETAKKQMAAYHELNDLLYPHIKAEYFRIFPGRRSSAEKYESNIHKKTLETARYVLPVATHAHMYHTIAGLTLYRYIRICQQFDTPLETKIVVDKMADEVRKIDPMFFEFVDDAIPLEKTPEYEMYQRFKSNGAQTEGGKPFIREFDSQLGNYRSKLVDYKVNAVSSMAMAVRALLGATKEKLSDEEAVRLVLDPRENTYLSSRLNVNTLTKLSRAMFHPHFTFMKKLSHTADSQNQRHRMTPGTRPILMCQFVRDEPDYILPEIVANIPELHDYFDNLMRFVWRSIDQLLDMGVSFEFAQYLLPNAYAIRFIESGDLLNLHHKWVQRLCYLAQEEIWRTCLEEVTQAKQVFPQFAEFIHAPCYLRVLTKDSPYCPEGNRYCGVRVWELKLEDFNRLI